MSYASFTNSPASTKLPAHSVAGGRAIPAGVGRSRLAALLVLAASTEFLLVAVAAYSAAVLYHRLILLELAGRRQVHPGIPSDFHIAVARFHRAPAIFPDPDAAPARVPMERRQRRLPRILLLHLDDIPSENLRRLLARYCHRPSCECPPYGTLHTGNMVLITTACHCIRVDRRQARHSYRRPGSLLAFFRIVQSPPEFGPSARSIFRHFAPTPQYRRAPAPSKCYLMPANWSRIAGPSERMTLSF